MKIQALKHVDFEGPAFIHQWAEVEGHELSVTELYTGRACPRPEEYDLLVLMGGAMGVNDEDRHDWLRAEKISVYGAIKAGKPVLGICLGAQLIAQVLGANVHKNKHAEIGWFPVKRIGTGLTEALFSAVQPEFTPFHWHADTFDVPGGAVPMAKSEACDNQAFVYNDRVIALQYHLETTAGSIEELIRNCGDEITEGPYMQKIEAIREQYIHIESCHKQMKDLLAYFRDIDKI